MWVYLTFAHSLVPFTNRTKVLEICCRQPQGGIHVFNFANNLFRRTYWWKMATFGFFSTPSGCFLRQSDCRLTTSEHFTIHSTPGCMFINIYIDYSANSVAKAIYLPVMSQASLWTAHCFSSLWNFSHFSKLSPHILCFLVNFCVAQHHSAGLSDSPLQSDTFPASQAWRKCICSLK